MRRCLPHKYSTHGQDPVNDKNRWILKITLNNQKLHLPGFYRTIGLDMWAAGPRHG